jgi:hypothetical protein
MAALMGAALAFAASQAAPSLAGSQDNPASTSEQKIEIGRFADSVVIPITSLGPHTWKSPPLRLDHDPDHFTTVARVDGDVSLNSFRATPLSTTDGTVLSIEFDVASYSPGGALVVVATATDDPSEGSS